jgi:hypothetical protein
MLSKKENILYNRTFDQLEKPSNYRLPKAVVKKINQLKKKTHRLFRKIIKKLCKNWNINND